MIRLYVPENLKVGLSVDLSEESIHYLTRVMRRKAGDTLMVFNQIQGQFLAVLHAGPGKHRFSVTLLHHQKAPEVLQKRGVALAIIKADKFLLCVEKATELGATDIYPLLTHHSLPRTACSLERAHKRAVEAAEQCERCTVPSIHPHETLQRWLGHRQNPWMAAVERCPSIDMPTAQQFQQCSGIVVGPEGGFSAQEKSILLSHALMTPISLGSSILRAETAVIALLSGMYWAHV